MLPWLIRHLRPIAALAVAVGLALQVPFVLGGSDWPQRVAQLAGMVLLGLGIGTLVSSSRWGRRRRAIYEQTRDHERELGEQQARRRLDDR